MDQGGGAVAGASNKLAEKPFDKPTDPNAGMVVTDADQAWWSFQPIRRPAAPTSRHADRVANPIDAFVLAKLEAKGLEPEPAGRQGDADPPGVLRPDRPAAAAGGGRSRSSPTPSPERL